MDRVSSTTTQRKYLGVEMHLLVLVDTLFLSVGFRMQLLVEHEAVYDEADDEADEKNQENPSHNHNQQRH